MGKLHGQNQNLLVMIFLHVRFQAPLLANFISRIVHFVANIALEKDYEEMLLDLI